MIDLHQLKIFAAVAREGSLTRASEAVFLSPPAVSGQLKALEETLGLSLFERESRGMRLTPAGKILLEEANLALSAASKVTAKAQFLKSGVHGDCRIGTILDPAILKLGEFISILIGRHPGLRLLFSQGRSGEIMECVLRGTLDAGYVIGNIDEPLLESFMISPVTLRVVGPYAWAKQLRNADWETLATFPWIATPETCSFHQISMQMFARRGVTPKTVIEADQESILRGFVASGVGLTLLREDIAVAAEAQDEAFIWEGGHEYSQLCFIYPRAAKTDVRVAAMLGAVKQIWSLPAD